MRRTKEFSEFVKQCEKWRSRFWLNAWDITYEAVDDSLGAAPTQAQDGAYNTIAETETVPAYLQANIKFRNAPRGQRHSEPMDSMACHEMLHVLLAPYSQMTAAAIDYAHEGDRAQLRDRHAIEKERFVSMLERIFTRGNADD